MDFSWRYYSCTFVTQSYTTVEKSFKTMQLYEDTLYCKKLLTIYIFSGIINCLFLKLITNVVLVVS